MKFCLGVFLLVWAGVATADFKQGPYLGIGFGGSTDIGVDNFEGDRVNLKIAELIAGYKYNNIFSLEARTGASLVEEPYATGETDANGRAAFATLSFDRYYSLYYRAEVSNPVAKLYLLAGGATVTLRNKFADGRTLTSASGQSFGVGAGLRVNSKTLFNIEYRAILATELEDIKVLAFNVDYRL